MEYVDPLPFIFFIFYFFIFLFFCLSMVLFSVLMYNVMFITKEENCENKKIHKIMYIYFCVKFDGKFGFGNFNTQTGFGIVPRMAVLSVHCDYRKCHNNLFKFLE